MKRAQIVFSEEKGLETMPKPALIQIPQLGRMLDACDKLDAWIKGVREHALHVLEAGQPVEGFKLVEKRGQRKWRDEFDAHLCAETDFGDMAFTEPKLLPPAQLEKKLAKAPGIDKWIAARVVCESSGVTVAREADKRPAVRLSADKVFDAVPALPEKKRKA